MKPNLFAALLLPVLGWTLTACATILFPPYSAEAIEASIIDADTRQPLEGVIVVANWEMRGRATAGGSAPIGQLVVMETATDKEGRFHFPAWGPKRSRGALLNHDPQLLLFKSDYHYLRLINKFRNDMDLEPLRRSDWNGKTIEMTRFVDAPMVIGPHKYETSTYAQHLSSLNTSIETIVISDCNWKKIPRLLVALKAQKDAFRQRGVRFSLIGADYVPTNTRECGDPDEFFRNYQP